MYTSNKLYSRYISIICSANGYKPFIAYLLLSTMALSLTGIFSGPAFGDGGYGTRENICTNTASSLRYACKYDSVDDYFEGYANCLNLTERSERRECISENIAGYRESRAECGAIHEARLDLCDDIGEAAYDPPFGEDYADNFVDPLEIGNSVTPNTYFPLVPGNQWIYEATFVDDEGEEVTETITVEVTEKTKLIQGITCIVVKDIVEEDGELVEDTDDWYAQDLQGNVWYCGEISENFEIFEGDEPEEAELVDIDGSWKAGRDGAKAGISISGMPVVGDFIRQEVAWGEAEDVIEILSVTGTEMTEAGYSCSNNCLVTRDFTPLEPDANENKYYAPGVGMIVEVKPDTGERLELLQFNTL